MILATKLYNLFHPARDLAASKQLWDSLAHKDAKWHIFSRAHGQTDDGFRASGKEEYGQLVASDPLIPKGGAALDLGCGTGRMTEFFKDDFSPVFGTDISAETVRGARERVPGVTFMETDGQSIPLPAESLDFIFSNAVFHHMPRLAIIENNLREVHRCLKPNGIAKIQFRGTLVKTNEWFYGHSFTEATLRDTLAAAGFAIKRIETVDRGNKRFFIALVQKL